MPCQRTGLPGSGEELTATEQALAMTRIAAAAAADKKAADIVALDVSEALVITDVFLLCTGNNEPQISAIRWGCGC